MTPFTISVPQKMLDAIAAKVRAYEWHEMPVDDGVQGSWAYGANLDFMKALCAYWLDGYDWRKWEKALNAFPQFVAPVERAHRDGDFRAACPDERLHLR